MTLSSPSDSMLIATLSLLCLTNTHTVETGLLAHALMGSIAELYALIFENALIIQ